MKYSIQSTSGQWWTGSCWGVKQAREEYALADLPLDLPKGNMDMSILDLIAGGNPEDCYYCDLDEVPGNDIVASVREVK
jgi:hypothetical protein